MLNTDHPLSELLKLSNFNMFSQESNYELFTTLKSALEEDGHAFIVRDEIDAIFAEPIKSSSDLVKQQGDVLRGMIEGWAQSVLAPMLERLNTYNQTDEPLTISMEGYLYDATLCFDGEVEEFVNNIKTSDLPAFQEVLEDWENTLNVIVNYGDLTDAIAAINN